MFVSHKEFQFQAQILGFDIRSKIYPSKHHCYSANALYNYMKLHNPVLPKSMMIDGTFALPKTINNALPESLNVLGNLNMIGCINITELPKFLTVAGYFDCSSTRVHKLPTYFKVEKSIHLSNTFISDVSMFENKTINGSLYLNNTKIKTLPNNLKVDGTLSLEESNLIELPMNLNVNHLMACRTKIKEIPSCCKVKHYLWLTGSSIEKLPDHLIVEDLYLNNSKHIKELPKYLTITGVLSVENTNIEVLPSCAKINTILRGEKFL